MYGYGFRANNKMFGGGATPSYYLDAYGTPVVWYEMVKRFSAYSGPCIRVRRASDNAELDIGFVDDLLDTSSLLSFIGAGTGTIATFYTQVGTANLIQVNGGAQPTIATSGSLITRNGFVSIKYDGTADFLYKSGATINTTNVSYFSISQNDVSNSIGTIFAQSSITPDTIRNFCDRRADKRNLVITIPIINYFANMSIQRDNSNLRLLSSFIDSSKNMSSFDNSATGGTDTYVGTTNNDGVQLGTQGVGLNFLNGSINCFGAYNTDNSANRVAIETILNNYYNIY